MKLLRTTSDHAAFQALSKELEQELAIRDGEQHIFYAELNKVDPMPTVVVAYHNGLPVGCGAIRKYDENNVELKRMFVKPAYRKQGIAGTILSELEQWAAALGYTCCLLETGKNQPEAIAFYQKHHYIFIPNFGKYTGSENSVCFRKMLQA